MRTKKKHFSNQDRISRNTNLQEHPDQQSTLTICKSQWSWRKTSSWRRYARPAAAWAQTCVSRRQPYPGSSLSWCQTRGPATAEVTKSRHTYCCKLNRNVSQTSKQTTISDRQGNLFRRKEKKKKRKKRATIPLGMCSHVLPARVCLCCYLQSDSNQTRENSEKQQKRITTI